MVTMRRPQEAHAIDTDYWLAHCDGYRVEVEGGRLGLVEEVRRAPSGQAATLVVRGGKLGLRRLIVPAEEVALLVPRAERVVLRSPPRITGSQPRGR